ncbi:MAG: cob(I)yrinic acid a,c-diamide adenosyltransferase [Sulfurisoma sp.]|nr:cob(I)yrinic acid a,c-diamide adenosyltransferase [Sulfurisoma sp.]
MGHATRMQRKKTFVDEKIATASVERGIFLINTGNGKGKSSAAFGLLARALGHGMTATVIQFVKSRSDTGEEAFFRQQPGVTWHVMGEGFTWETQDAARDAAAARAAWDMALQALADPAQDIVILDEFTYTLKYRWLEIDAVLAGFKARPPTQHLVVTGRGAPLALVAAADTVTDMTPLKHAFQSGVKAMPGVEW